MVRAMRPEDWSRVEYIYKQGVERGTSTFTTECPDYEHWNQTYHQDCRFVYEADGVVAGFVAISPVRVSHITAVWRKYAFMWMRHIGDGESAKHC